MEEDIVSRGSDVYVELHILENAKNIEISKEIFMQCKDEILRMAKYCKDDNGYIIKEKLNSIIGGIISARKDLLLLYYKMYKNNTPVSTISTFSNMSDKKLLQLFCMLQGISTEDFKNINFSISHNNIHLEYKK